MECDGPLVQYDLCLDKKGQLGHVGRMPCEGKSRDGDDVSISQEMPKITSQPGEG